MISYDLTMEQLLPVALELGEMNYLCMELLNRANTGTDGL
jgi:hydroxylamine reductase